MNLAWPESDTIARHIIGEEVNFLDKALQYCRPGLAIQAGGNAGVYPLYLAEYFKMVLTFEPEAENFKCLLENIASVRNIAPIQACLGARKERVGMSLCPSNTGAHRVVAGDSVDVISIDSIGLLECAFIQLDVEGYELNALQGAVELIEKCHPVIMVEDNGLSTSYGTPKGGVIHWLEDRGYRVVESNKTDYILCH